ncbi:uncharacterized protein LOC108683419 isoform X1 [Hyalella azteca]|uniref:Uncharacterized protein LOC108683419 isoform X1 n=1 Tax=Hyalella azteca TaxID=294128 RepID=A0A8B7PPT1_HYAAZ|nr:uncharacterized protein LOC108683419 isoform X1 [Hyalella azteca]XP_018028220.1 uncharacterized protein LOC108683419 isoform X1 [Hyalella azteca]
MLVATRTWLVAVALVVGMSSVHTADTTPPRKCRTGQITACMSCSQVGTCASATQELTSTGGKTCTSSQVCRETGNTAVCVPASSTNVCNNCGNQPKGCDPYNPLIVHTCRPGQAPIKMKECSGAETCSAGACVGGTSDPNSPAAVCNKNEALATEPKFFLLKPTCTSGVLCLAKTVDFIFNCSSGYYFDQISGTCKSLPVNHCEGITVDGSSPHLTNCSKFVVCQGGVVESEIECDAGEVFSSIGNGCIVRPTPPAPSGCPDMDGCTFASSGPVNTTSGTGTSSTTTTPPTTDKPPCSASNVNKRYPHPSDPKRYYTCRLISGIYKYVELICSGNMVYNRTTTYCETPTTPSGR